METNDKRIETNGCPVADDDEEEDWKEMGLVSRAAYVLQNITVEPLLALYKVSSVLTGLTTQNLNLHKACRVNMRMDDHVCVGMLHKNASYHEQEVLAQQLVTNMQLWQTAIQNGVLCVLVVFIGSWSDRNRKRKPCMLVPVVGELVRNAGLVLCVYYFDELRLEIAGLVESVPIAFAGGTTVLYMAAFSYMGEKTTVKNRTLRIGLMNLFFNSSYAIGRMLSGFLLHKCGYFGMYNISTALYTIALLYGLIHLKENHSSSIVNNDSDQVSRSCMYLVNDFFDLKHIKEAFKVTFNKTSHERWVKLIMLMITVVVVHGPTQGEMLLDYMNTRVRFNWDAAEYGYYSTFLFMTNLLGIGIAIGILSHRFKVDDSLIGIISCISKVLGGIVFAFAPTGIFYYVGAVVDLMSSCSYIVVRSIISKSVPKSELGQVSAIVAVLETLAPMIYKPLYSLVYYATVGYFPGAFYLVSAVLLSPSIVIYWRMYRMNTQESN